jgi:molybdopterin converting factor small subunit
MKIKVVIGGSVCPDTGSGEEEVTFSDAETVTLGELARRLDITLSTPEGALMVLINNTVAPWEKSEETELKDGDVVAIHRMLAGG